MTPATLRKREAFEAQLDELAQLWGVAYAAAWDGRQVEGHAGAEVLPGRAVETELDNLRAVYGDWLEENDLPAEAEAQRLLADRRLLLPAQVSQHAPHRHRFGGVSAVADSVTSWHFGPPQADLPLLEAAFLTLLCRAGAPENLGRPGHSTRRAAEALLAHALVLAYVAPPPRLLCRALRLTWTGPTQGRPEDAPRRTLADWGRQGVTLAEHAVHPGDRGHLVEMCAWLAGLEGAARAAWGECPSGDFCLLPWPLVPAWCPPDRLRAGGPERGTVCYEALQLDRAILLHNLFLELPPGVAVPAALVGCRRGEPVWPETMLVS